MECYIQYFFIHFVVMFEILQEWDEECVSAFGGQIIHNRNCRYLLPCAREILPILSQRKPVLALLSPPPV